jgi:uncharacterized membrane protein
MTVVAIGVYEAVLVVILVVRYAALPECCGQAWAASAAMRKVRKRGRKNPILLKILVANRD